MKNILLHGCYHNNNFGDLLLADLMAKKIRNLTGQNVLCPWTYGNKETLFYAKSGKGIRSWFDFTHAVFGGGGYLNSNEKGWFSKKILRYFIPAFLCKIQRKPYMILGVGAGPKIKFFDKVLVKFICDNAQLIYVRDDESKDVLIKTGVSASKIGVTADFALTLSEKDFAPYRSKKIEKYFERYNGKKIIGIHLQSIKDEGKLEEVLMNINSSLENTHIPIMFFDHVKSKQHLDMSIEKMKRISQRYLPALVFYDEILNHWELCSFILKMDAIITSKLHVGIVGWVLEVPIFGCSSHGKTKRFFRQVGRSQYQISSNYISNEISKWVKGICQSDKDNFLDDPHIRKKMIKASQKNNHLLEKFLLNDIKVV